MKVTQVVSKMVRDTVTVFILMKTVELMKENGLWIKSKVLEYRNGSMKESTLVSGKRVESTDKEFTHGQMAIDMKGSIKMISIMDLERTPGQMAHNIEASGKKVKCTESYFTGLKMELKKLKFGKEMNKYKIKMD